MLKKIMLVGAILGALTMTSTAFATDENDENDEKTTKPFNPLSLVKMIKFGGPEEEGFHNCFWIGPTSYKSYNIAWPDEGAIYWSAKFDLPDNVSHLEIDGKYPNARYMSYNTYDKLTQPIYGVLDADITAYEGHNPYTSEDKSGGRYKLTVIPGEAPQKLPENTLYMGDKTRKNTDLSLILRIYVPENGTDFTGGAGLPKVSAVMKDGSRLTDEKMCEVINSPIPGKGDRRLASVVIEKDTYTKLINDPKAPKAFPATKVPNWWAFFGGDIAVSRFVPNSNYVNEMDKLIISGKRKKMAGFYSNTHNNYISAYLDETFGEVVVLQGKMPSIPENGWDVANKNYDLRYWSLCTNESIATTRYSDCVYDRNVTLDAESNYTIVVSKKGKRPTNATAECGVTWLDWGDAGDGIGNPDAGMLIIRNMLGNGFKHSIQNVASTLSAKKSMGEFFPETSYSSKANFEALGCSK